MKFFILISVVSCVKNVFFKKSGCLRTALFNRITNNSPIIFATNTSISECVVMDFKVYKL